VKAVKAIVCLWPEARCIIIISSFINSWWFDFM